MRAVLLRRRGEELLPGEAFMGLGEMLVPSRCSPLVEGILTKVGTDGITAISS